MNERDLAEIANKLFPPVEGINNFTFTAEAVAGNMGVSASS